MFEKTIPIPKANPGPHRVPNSGGGAARTAGSDGAPAGAPAAGGQALRALDWNEVTARLNAARDLRELMRRDSRLNIQAAAASFGDAAATYFRAIESDERTVNHDALGSCKASGCIGKNPMALQQQAMRETLND